MEIFNGYEISGIILYAKDAGINSKFELDNVGKAFFTGESGNYKYLVWSLSDRCPDLSGEDIHDNPNQPMNMVPDVVQGAFDFTHFLQ